MRINLTTPFAEKDQAKALGARWDAARKLWYIQDVADLTPFMRWIPDLSAATAAADVAGSRPAAAAAGHAAAPAVTTQPTQTVPRCGCKVLPWEDCTHSTARV